jgi:hypothetical protein
MFSAKRMGKFGRFVCSVCTAKSTVTDHALMGAIHDEIERLLIDRDITRGSAAHTSLEEEVTNELRNATATGTRRRRGH